MMIMLCFCHRCWVCNEPWLLQFEPVFCVDKVASGFCVQGCVKDAGQTLLYIDPL